MNFRHKVDPKLVARAARLYHLNADAARALHILPSTFGRLCQEYEIESPYARRRRRLREQGLP